MPRQRTRRAEARRRPMQRVKYCPPPESEAVEDWHMLHTGDHVIVLDRENLPVMGRINELSVDADVIWIDQDQHRGRRMFARTDRCPLWRLP